MRATHRRGGGPVRGARLNPMGLDVFNGLFGNFHLNWAGTSWFSKWCAERGLPDPFIGWESGCNNGDQCHLGPGATHTPFAREWCEALDEKVPDVARLGRQLLADPPDDLHQYLYAHARGDNGAALSEPEWERRAVAAWYAILRHGLQQGGALEYW